MKNRKISPINTLFFLIALFFYNCQKIDKKNNPIQELPKISFLYPNQDNSSISFFKDSKNIYRSNLELDYSGLLPNELSIWLRKSNSQDTTWIQQNNPISFSDDEKNENVFFKYSYPTGNWIANISLENILNSPQNGKNIDIQLRDTKEKPENNILAQLNNIKITLDTHSISQALFPLGITNFILYECRKCKKPNLKIGINDKKGIFKINSLGEYDSNIEPDLIDLVNGNIYLKETINGHTSSILITPQDLRYSTTMDEIISQIDEWIVSQRDLNYGLSFYNKKMASLKTEKEELLHELEKEWFIEELNKNNKIADTLDERTLKDYFSLKSKLKKLKSKIKFNPKSFTLNIDESNYYSGGSKIRYVNLYLDVENCKNVEVFYLLSDSLAEGEYLRSRLFASPLYMKKSNQYGDFQSYENYYRSKYDLWDKKSSQYNKELEAFEFKPIILNGNYESKNIHLLVVAYDSLGISEHKGIHPVKISEYIKN